MPRTPIRQAVAAMAFAASVAVLPLAAAEAEPLRVDRKSVV